MIGKREQEKKNSVKFAGEYSNPNPFWWPRLFRRCHFFFFLENKDNLIFFCCFFFLYSFFKKSVKNCIFFEICSTSFFYKYLEYYEKSMCNAYQKKENNHQCNNNSNCQYCNKINKSLKRCSDSLYNFVGLIVQSHRHTHTLGDRKDCGSYGH